MVEIGLFIYLFLSKKLSSWKLPKKQFIIFKRAEWYTLPDSGGKQKDKIVKQVMQAHGRIKLKM